MEEKKKKYEALLEKKDASSKEKKLSEKKMKKVRHAMLEEKFGYTNECNPFNDNKLSNPFVWKRKQKVLSAMGRIEKEKTATEFLNHTKQKISEIENVKKRREAREEEERLLAEQQTMLARERELENYDEWEAREEAFHRLMACRRTDVRLKQNREKACDLIVKGLRLLNGEEFEDMTVLHCYPHQLFDEISLEELEKLLEEIQTHYDIASVEEGTQKTLKSSETPFKFTQQNESLYDSAHSSSYSFRIWKALRFLALEKKAQLIEECQSMTEPSTAVCDKTRDLHSGIALTVLNDVAALLETKSLQELTELERDINQKRRAIRADPSSDVDLNYWDMLGQKLPRYKAIACLKDMHTNVLRLVKGVAVKQAQAALQKRCQKKKDQNEHVPLTPCESSANDTKDTVKQEKNSEPWVPPTVAFTSLKRTNAKIMSEAEFLKMFYELRQTLIKAYSRESDVVSFTNKPLEKTLQDKKNDALYDNFVMLEKKDMTPDEFIMTPAYMVDMPYTPNEQWQSKYVSRKPRFFNRVKTGYEWSKYNQTHYDRDNPPPKAVQGYKFNLFYPDLLDKTKAPTWKLLRSDEPETVLLKFHGGPPYEDVVFKIFNREWDLNPRTGYRNVYDRVLVTVELCNENTDNMDLEIEGLKALYGDTEVEFITCSDNQLTLKINVELCPFQKPVTFVFQLCEPFQLTSQQANILSPQGNEDILNEFLKEAITPSCREFPCFFQIIEKVRNAWISFCRNPPVTEQKPVADPPPAAPQVIPLDPFTGDIFSGDVIVDRKSVFQAHVASVSSCEEVRKFKKTLLCKPKIAKATHNIMAYRFLLKNSTIVCGNKKKLFLKKKGSQMTVVQDHDSDGEKAAGGRLSTLLQILDLKNVVVVVSRWYGGIPLGPYRFRHINNCARNTLQKAGFLSNS